MRGRLAIRFRPRTFAGVQSPRTLLVVDDDRSIRFAAADALRRAGFVVLEAGSGAEALAALAAHRGALDLLITDVAMRGMDGGELAEVVAADRPGVRVLYMSGYTAGAALHDTVRDDGVAFIAKPFLHSELLQRVQSVLGPD